MAKNVNKKLQSIARWNVFVSENGSMYEPVFPFAVPFSEARRCAVSYRLMETGLRLFGTESSRPKCVFVVLPYGYSF